MLRTNDAGTSGSTAAHWRRTALVSASGGSSVCINQDMLFASQMVVGSGTWAIGTYASMVTSFSRPGGPALEAFSQPSIANHPDQRLREAVGVAGLAEQAGRARPSPPGSHAEVDLPCATRTKPLARRPLRVKYCAQP
jgi:hypothetical protein